MAFFYEHSVLKCNQATLDIDKYMKSCTGRSALEADGIELVALTRKYLVTLTEIGKGFGM